MSMIPAHARWVAQQHARLSAMLGSEFLAGEWEHMAVTEIPPRYMDRVIGLMSAAWQQGRHSMKLEHDHGGWEPPHHEACAGFPQGDDGYHGCDPRCERRLTRRRREIITRQDPLA